MPRALEFTLLLVMMGAVSRAGPASRPAPAKAVLEELASRRAAVMELLRRPGLLVVESGRMQPGPAGCFAEDPDFRYLVGGVAGKQMALVLETRRRGAHRVTLFLPERDPDRELWEGWHLTVGPEAVQHTGIAQVRPWSALGDHLEAAASRVSRVYHNLQRPPSPRDAPTGLLALLAKGYRGSSRVLVDPVAGRPTVLTASLRQVKSSSEIARMEEAVRITSLALEKVIPRIEAGLFEYQLQALIEATFRWEGAGGLAFRSIVGTGGNSTILHYRAGNGLLQDGEVVLMDVGCRYEGYCADLTRTVPVSGTFTPRQRELYELVLEAQGAALAEIRPRRTLEQAKAAAVRVFEAAGVEEYFVHGIGHYLGIQVHDVGAGITRLLPGMVVTVEPGLYLPEEGIGIRIEDDVLVTEQGHRVLSAGLARTVEEVEALMKGDER